MHIVDVVVVCVAILLVLLCAVVLARQRFMLRAPGTMPVAMRSTNAMRWQFGVGRYEGADLCWYRSLGLGTRPNRVFHREGLQVLGRRSPVAAERQSLPESAVVVECRDRGRPVFLALGEESTYTGFVSWVESSAPTL